MRWGNVRGRLRACGSACVCVRVWGACALVPASVVAVAAAVVVVAAAVVVVPAPPAAVAWAIPLGGAAGVAEPPPDMLWLRLGDCSKCIG